MKTAMSNNATQASLLFQVLCQRYEKQQAIILTSNKALAAAPGNTLLPRKQTRLPMDSIANASQIATLDKEDLETLVGVLPRRLLDRVDEGVRWFFGLDR